MNRQSTSTILMIRPVAFRYNEQTAGNNHYQKVVEGLNPNETQDKALAEFDAFAEMLTQAGLEVIVFEDTLEPDTPDSIFPNNWVSFHENGTVVLYPMFASNRRDERRMDIIESLQAKYGYRVDHILDLSYFEKDHIFLEGTGSMVLDRQNQIAYACLSQRTDEKALEEFCRKMDYKEVSFNSSAISPDGDLTPIYHTNVMMSVGKSIAVVCLDTIRNEQERNKVVKSLEETGKTIVNITEAQKNFFAGNMLQTVSKDGTELMVMSEQAYRSLSQEQIQTIETNHKIIYSPLDIIEACGGGSARCMMAEIFLPKK